ncbi:MAG: DNA polymerase III subunit alpha [Acidobacteria bacterium]|nr:DNA polymerase III subunit alpha [Acidobacteriota bacterium]
MGDSFSHLHVHTEFSMLDGASRLDELVQAAVRDGQPALGITDHGNMYGVLDFYRECRRNGIKPVIGTEAYMAHESRTERPSRRGRVDDTGGETDSGGKLYYHLTLLAESSAGYRNLIKLSSLAFLEGFYYQPRMDWELLARHSEGLIATSGCLGGHVLQRLSRGDEEGAWQAASRLQDIFGRGNFFIELQDHGIAEQRRTNPMLIDLASRLGAPLLATNDTHYTAPGDHVAHDALLCVQTGSRIADPDRFRFEGDQHYLKTAAEMRWLFREVPAACDNTLLIAERAGVEIEFGKPVLPDFPIPEGFADDRHYLEHLTREGARRRWGAAPAPEVVERLAYELKVIADMGFSSYFLIVWDLIRYARESGIRVGPGRGSAAGCAVAYCLGITDLDPVRYGLIFERFLNPSRISMPDIDMDFDSRYRDQMIRYATDRYGRDHVAQIITFGTIKARNAVRDAARVLGHPYAVGDKIAKLMPPVVMGRDVPLRYCFERDDAHLSGYQAAADLRALYDTDPVAREVVDVARGIEGLKRSAGIHAAAVVITKEPLTAYLPVQRKPEPGMAPEDAPVVTQFEMHGVESLGLLKMDILGLRNLDVMTDATAMIRGRGHPEFDVDRIPLDDEATYRLLANGDTIGVFQMESGGMRSLLRSLQPERFEDVCVCVALYRPGPMSANMHHDYAAFKNRRKPVSYFHADAEEVLNDTYGLIVYQESLMRVAQRFAGYSMAEADNLRKACGKKDKALMKQQAAAFIDGCERHGYGRALGEQLFSTIEQFADYAFAKSHAYGYGLIAYQTAYLKAHHPVEYLACLLTSVKGDYDRAAVHLADARASGIVVMPPDVNVSGTDFAPAGGEGDRRISFGLSAIRNVGEGLVSMVLAERDRGGPFESFHDFCERVPEQALNKRAIESMISAGAFDGLGHPRKGLLMVHASVIDRAIARRRERERGLMSLFGDGDGGESGYSERVPVPDVEFGPDERLRLEKTMLGLYVSGHPLHGLEHVLRSRRDSTVDDAKERQDGEMVRLSGLVASLVKRHTKAGAAMATFDLEDLTGTIPATVFPKVLEKVAASLAEDAVVAVRGRIDKRDEGEPGIAVIDLEVLPAIRPEHQALHIDIPPHALTDPVIDSLKALLTAHSGGTPVFLHIGAGKVIRLGGEFSVELDRVMGPLRAMFGDGAYVA